MSYLQHCLDLFQYKSLDNVTADNLKRSFKKRIIEVHPDKGGNEDDFEIVVNAYMYTSQVLQRVSGGRQMLHTLASPEELCGMRSKELIRETNQILNEVFEGLQDDTALQDKTYFEKFNKEFNDVFEKTHDRENQHGYKDWLSDETNGLKEEEEKEEKEKGKDFNELFESSIRCGKPYVETSLALHPDDMAYYSGGGVLLMEDEGSTYTQSTNVRPAYTDVYAAFTAHNTIIDKLPAYKTETIESAFERQCKERQVSYQTELDADLAAIAAYEQATYNRQKQEKEMEHQKKLAEYFNGDYRTRTIMASCYTSEPFSKEF
jgi:hypothetical protein